MKLARDCHCPRLRDRPATTSLPFEESGSFRDAQPLEKQGDQEPEALRTATDIGYASDRCCLVVRHPWTRVSATIEERSAKTGRSVDRRPVRARRSRRVDHFDARSSHQPLPPPARGGGSRCYYFFSLFLFKPITLRGNRYEFYIVCTC